MEKREIDLKWAQTLDGQLCDDSGTSQWITSDSELDHTHYIRSKYHGILVGAGTFLTDRAQLTVRRYKDFTGDQPVRIILDPKDRVSQHLEDTELGRALCPLLLKGDRPTVIIGGGRGIDLESFGKSVVYVSHLIDLDIDNQKIAQELDTALDKAEKALGRKLTRILVEGGPTLLTTLAEQQAFNKLYVSVAPKITGGYRYRINTHRNLANSLDFNLVDVSVRANDVVFEYQPLKRPQAIVQKGSAAI